MQMDANKFYDIRKEYRILCNTCIRVFMVCIWIWNTITMRHEYPKRNGSKLCRNIDTETQTLDVKLLESENIALASSMLFAIACHRPKRNDKIPTKMESFCILFFFSIQLLMLSVTIVLENSTENQIKS